MFYRKHPACLFWLSATWITLAITAQAWSNDLYIYIHGVTPRLHMVLNEAETTIHQAKGEMAEEESRFAKEVKNFHTIVFPDKPICTTSASLSKDNCVKVLPFVWKELPYEAAQTAYRNQSGLIGRSFYNFLHDAFWLKRFNNFLKVNEYFFSQEIVQDCVKDERCHLHLIGHSAGSVLLTFLLYWNVAYVPIHELPNLTPALPELLQRPEGEALKSYYNAKLMLKFLADNHTVGAGYHSFDQFLDRQSAHASNLMKSIAQLNKDENNLTDSDKTWLIERLYQNSNQVLGFPNTSFVGQKPSIQPVDSKAEFFREVYLELADFLHVLNMLKIATIISPSIVSCLENRKDDCNYQALNAFQQDNLLIKALRLMTSENVKGSYYHFIHLYQKWLSWHQRQPDKSDATIGEAFNHFMNELSGGNRLYTHLSDEVLIQYLLKTVQDPSLIPMSKLLAIVEKYKVDNYFRPVAYENYASLFQLYQAGILNSDLLTFNVDPYLARLSRFSTFSMPTWNGFSRNSGVIPNITQNKVKTVIFMGSPLTQLTSDFLANTAFEGLSCEGSYHKNYDRLFYKYLFSSSNSNGGPLVYFIKHMSDPIAQISKASSQIEGLNICIIRNPTINPHSIYWKGQAAKSIRKCLKLQREP